jgi:hypothetical protein
MASTALIAQRTNLRAPIDTVPKAIGNSEVPLDKGVDQVMRQTEALVGPRPAQLAAVVTRHVEPVFALAGSGTNDLHRAGSSSSSVPQLDSV